MIVLFVSMSIIGPLLILPGWLWARRNTPQSLWILWLPIAGILFWIGLTILGVGAQSLSNISETFIVFMVSICSSYLKFTVFDRNIKHRTRGTLYVTVIVLIVTLGLRLLMPSLPE